MHLATATKPNQWTIDKPRTPRGMQPESPLFNPSPQASSSPWAPTPFSAFRSIQRHPQLRCLPCSLWSAFWKVPLGIVSSRLWVKGWWHPSALCLGCSVRWERVVLTARSSTLSLGRLRAMRSRGTLLLGCRAQSEVTRTAGPALGSPGLQGDWNHQFLRLLGTQIQLRAM